MISTDAQRPTPQTTLSPNVIFSPLADTKASHCSCHLLHYSLLFLKIDFFILAQIGIKCSSHIIEHQIEIYHICICEVLSALCRRIAVQKGFMTSEAAWIRGIKGLVDRGTVQCIVISQQSGVT